MSFYHWDWDVFMFYDVWAWIPLAWSFSGCLTGALIYWLVIEVPKHLETKKKKEKKIDNGEFKNPGDINNNGRLKGIAQC